MSKRESSVAGIFEYNPGGINLTGFPSCPILDTLRGNLGNEVLLKGYRREFKGKWIVNPSFNPEHTEKRQAFFKRLKTTDKPGKTFFDREIPNVWNSRMYASYQAFFALCNEVYETLDTARAELKPFRHLNETRRVFRGINGLGSRLEGMLKTLKNIDEADIFAVDTDQGLVAVLPRMPKINTHFRERRGSYSMDELLYQIRLKMKKQALEIAQDIGLEFKKKILEFVKNEFRFSSDKNNLRRSFEELAVPVRLHSSYSRFLKRCEDYDEWKVKAYLERLDDEGIEGDDRAYYELLCKSIKSSVPLMRDPVYPGFSDHYDIKGLFPPKLMERCGFYTPFVPIDFQTKPGEDKFLISGLHNGSKSFFLENLLLLSIIAQTGLPLCAESLTLPSYERIIYYNNQENTQRNSRNQDGRCVGELRDINELIEDSRKGDLLVLDEFLDAAQIEIANVISPDLLKRLSKTPATIYVTSHRCTDYRLLRRQGWRLLTPDYKDQAGEIIPLKRLKRGAPNGEVNKRYTERMYEQIKEQGT